MCIMLLGSTNSPSNSEGGRILISAQGNLLRALLMDLAGKCIEQVESFKIPAVTRSSITLTIMVSRLTGLI